MQLFGFLPEKLTDLPDKHPQKLYYYAYFMEEWAEKGCSYFYDKINIKKQDLDFALEMYVNGNIFGEHKLKNSYAEAHDACILQINVALLRKYEGDILQEAANEIDQWLEEFKDTYCDELHENLLDFIYGSTLIFHIEVSLNPWQTFLSNPQKYFNQFKITKKAYVQPNDDNLLILSEKPDQESMFSQYVLFSMTGRVVDWFKPESNQFLLPDIVAHKAYRLGNQMSLLNIDKSYDRLLNNLKNESSLFLQIIGQDQPPLDKLNKVADLLSNSMMALVEIQDFQASTNQQYLNLEIWSENSGNNIWYWHLKQINTISQNLSTKIERGKNIIETARFALNTLELKQQYKEGERKDLESKKFNSFQSAFIIIGVAVAISQFIDQSIADHIFCNWLNSNGYPPWNKILVQTAAILMFLLIYIVFPVGKRLFQHQNQE